MIHELKIAQEYFDRVVDGSKTFEIRYNDRGYQKGDTVVLTSVDSKGVPEVPKRQVQAIIGFVTGYAQKPDYVVFSILNVMRLADDA